ncbi:MAG: hypothetical protein IKN66_04445 [Ruminococcus sp.]|nr:hypothetical protein [Ruminococcus sp.]
MFISDTDESRRRVVRHAAGELGGALFCAVFGMIYEVFSHEVYSYWMIYAFMFPLAAGLILLLAALKCRRCPRRKFLNTFNAASATLSLGSIAAGVVNIYGSTNVLLRIYPAAGAFLLLTALYFFITERREHLPAAASAGSSAETPSV